ncbi:MAG: hypothetical protein WD448_08155 [Woeseia sp.]
MTGGDAELVVLALVLLILFLIFAVVWFFFLVPMEKGLHKRRMELLQKKLQQNEERLQRQADEERRGPANGQRVEVQDGRPGQ